MFLAFGEYFGWGFGQDPAVDHDSVSGADAHLGSRNKLQEIRGGQRAEMRQRSQRRAFALGFGERGRVGIRDRSVLHFHDAAEGCHAESGGVGISGYRSTLGYHAMKQSFRERRGYQNVGIDGSGRLAEDGDIRGIAAECRNVLVHPLERGDLVRQAVIAGGMMRRLAGEFGMSEEAEDRHAIVNGHQYDSAAREAFAIEVCARGGAGIIAAAMQPDHHRHGRARRPFGGPDIEEKAVLTAAGEHAAVRVLGTGGAEGSGVAFAGPWLCGRRRTPAKVAHGRRRVWDAFEDRPALRERRATNAAGLQRDDGIGRT